MPIEIDTGDETFDEDTRARAEEPDPEPAPPAARADAAEDEDEDEDEPPPVDAAEISRIARNILRRAHEPRVQRELAQLLEECEADPRCAAIVAELETQVAGDLLGAAVDGSELGAPWINLTKLGPLAAFIPPQVTAGVDLLNAAKSTIDSISKPAKAKLAAVTADANAGDPKAQAAMQTLHQAVALQKAQGNTPQQDGAFRRGPDVHPARQGTGGFSHYHEAMRWMREGR